MSMTRKAMNAMARRKAASRDKQVGIPTIPADVPANLRPLLEAMRDSLQIYQGGRGDVLDEAVTKRDLIGSDITVNAGNLKVIDGNGNQTPLPPTVVEPVQRPTIPTGVSITALSDIVAVSWDRPAYSGHWLTEVLVQQTALDGNGDAVDPAQLDPATMVWGTTAGTGLRFKVRPHLGYYVWVRHVNTMNMPGPVHATSGTFVKPIIDPREILDTISDHILRGDLAPELENSLDQYEQDIAQAKQDIIDNDTAINQRVQDAEDRIQTAEDDIDVLEGDYTVLEERAGRIEETARLDQQHLDQLAEAAILDASTADERMIKNYKSEAGIKKTIALQAEENAAQALQLTELYARVGTNESNISHLDQVIVNDIDGAISRHVDNYTVSYGGQTYNLSQIVQVGVDTQGQVTSMWEIQMPDDISKIGFYQANDETVFKVVADLIEFSNGESTNRPFILENNQLKLDAAYIKGLSVQDLKISGDATFAGTLVGADGTFTGTFSVADTFFAGQDEQGNSLVRINADKFFVTHPYDTQPLLLVDDLVTPKDWSASLTASMVHQRQIVLLLRGYYGDYSDIYVTVDGVEYAITAISGGIEGSTSLSEGRASFSLDAVTSGYITLTLTNNLSANFIDPATVTIQGKVLVAGLNAEPIFMGWMPKEIQMLNGGTQVVPHYFGNYAPPEQGSLIMPRVTVRNLKIPGTAIIRDGQALFSTDTFAIYDPLDPENKLDFAVSDVDGTRWVAIRNASIENARLHDVTVTGTSVLKSVQIIDDSTFEGNVEIKGGKINIGDQFEVDELGNLNAQAGYFGGTLSSGVEVLSPHVKGGLINGSIIYGAMIVAGSSDIKAFAEYNYSKYPTQCYSGGTKLTVSDCLANMAAAWPTDFMDRIYFYAFDYATLWKNKSVDWAYHTSYKYWNTYVSRPAVAAWNNTSTRVTNRLNQTHAYFDCRLTFVVEEGKMIQTWTKHRITGYVRHPGLIWYLYPKNNSEVVKICAGQVSYVKTTESKTFSISSYGKTCTVTTNTKPHSYGYSVQVDVRLWLPYDHSATSFKHQFLCMRYAGYRVPIKVSMRLVEGQND